MKLPAPQNTLRRVSGFTLVEIAISLAVIAFALVAIIGVLPTGMQVQRDNREETIINQEATYFATAIRNGARGLDEGHEHRPEQQGGAAVPGAAGPVR